jgi:hypothetical protein
MNFTKETRTASILIMSLYLLYGLFHIPFTQFLISLAVAGIVFGITDTYEYAVLGLLGMNFLFPVLKGPGYEGFMNASASEVSERVKSIQHGTYGVVPKKEGFEEEEEADDLLPGVGSELTEGFQDASGQEMTLNTNTTKTEKEVSTGQSTPAPTAAAAPAAPAASAPATISAQGVPPANQPASTVNTPVANPAPAANTSTAGFQDNSSLFKLGQIPVDQKGGFHIDAGTTVVNALNALKPDQIRQMTSDTRQLIETQKSLMGMLSSFQPMMQEGRQMMNTFQQMFSPTAGAAPPK